MISAVTQFFIDWNDACVYARECGLGGIPGFKFGEPWNFLAMLLIVCYVLYRINERGLRRAPDGRSS